MPAILQRKADDGWEPGRQHVADVPKNQKRSSAIPQLDGSNCLVSVENQPLTILIHLYLSLLRVL